MIEKSTVVLLFFLSMMTNFYLVLPYVCATLLILALLAALAWDEERGREREDHFNSK